MITEGMFMIFNLLKFSDALQRLEKADKLKNDFLCRMSHELRTPLSGIIGAIDILKFAPLTDEYVKLINIAKSCSTNLLQVINDILDFSKIEAGKMKLMTEKIKLKELVEEAAQVISPLLNQKKSIRFKLEVSPQVPESITNDKVKIKQILVNLLSNAVKFTNEGSISLHVDTDTSEGIVTSLATPNTMTKDWSNASKFVRFSVTDTGIGINSKDFESVFSAFEQASLKQDGQVVGGTGLGLNICLLLVKLMQGAISVRSDGPETGSIFAFWIPVGDESTQSVLHTIGEAEFTSSPTLISEGARGILLVEDNPINQVVIKGQLQKLGCSVDIAGNGQIAVQKLKLTPRPHYDIILLDLEMPVKDGIETSAELRSMGVTTPIIALTAHAVEEKRTMALKAGMDDFLMKPCSIDTLKQCLDYWSKRKKSSRRNSLV
jgi:signal transduction histidine kinase/CheY-like chemotaxis protein